LLQHLLGLSDPTAHHWEPRVGLYYRFVLRVERLNRCMYESLYYVRMLHLTDEAAFDEQKRLNTTPKKRCRGGVGGRDRNASSVKAGKKAVAKLAKQISALTTRVQDVEKK
jgi:hypothetical protein